MLAYGGGSSRAIDTPLADDGHHETEELTMLDYIIRGGQVVTPWGVGGWEVAIQGEKIVAVAAPGTLTSDIGRVIDATGKIVIPGGIEPHAHIAAPIMGYPGMETAPTEQVS